MCKFNTPYPPSKPASSSSASAGAHNPQGFSDEFMVYTWKVSLARRRVLTGVLISSMVSKRLVHGGVSAPSPSANATWPPVYQQVHCTGRSFALKEEITRRSCFMLHV